MGHGHGHGHAVAPESASGRYLRNLVVALGIGAGFMVLEFVVGITTRSLALISDAAHMFTDVLGVGMALAAILLARRSGPTASRTFGMYRAEVLPTEKGRMTVRRLTPPIKGERISARRS